MSTTQIQLEQIFGELEDPRIDRTKKHPFISILFISMCGSLAGINTWVGLEDYTESHFYFLKSRIDLSAGIPSHDTFARVLGHLDVDGFNRCFMEFVNLLKEKLPGVIAIDGKTSRGSRKRDKSVLHCVSAWGDENSLVLGQVMTDEKSNEITAIPKLLDLLDLKGQTVTIDAMGTQKDIAKKIIDKGGDYILALKGNQSSLHEDVKLFFEDKDLIEVLESYEETDGGHGRIEVRKCTVSDDIDWLKSRHPKWENLRSIAMIESEREVGGKTTKEKRYYISSHGADAKYIGQSIRAHWGVENKLHWVLDVVCGEDNSRIRTHNAPAVMAIFRRWSLNILRQNKDKISLRRKQEKIKMSPKYLLQYLNLKF